MESQAYAIIDNKSLTKWVSAELVKSNHSGHEHHVQPNVIPNFEDYYSPCNNINNCTFHSYIGANKFLKKRFDAGYLNVVATRKVPIFISFSSKLANYLISPTCKYLSGKYMLDVKKMAVEVTVNHYVNAEKYDISVFPYCIVEVGGKILDTSIFKIDNINLTNVYLAFPNDKESSRIAKIEQTVAKINEYQQQIDQLICIKNSLDKL